MTVRARKNYYQIYRSEYISARHDATGVKIPATGRSVMKLLLSVPKDDLDLGALKGGEAHIPRRCLEALRPAKRKALEDDLEAVQRKLHPLVLASEREALREDFAAITAMAQRLGERLDHRALAETQVPEETSKKCREALGVFAGAMRDRGHWEDSASEQTRGADRQTGRSGWTGRNC